MRTSVQSHMAPRTAGADVAGAVGGSAKGKQLLSQALGVLVSSGRYCTL